MDRGVARLESDVARGDPQNRKTRGGQEGKRLGAAAMAVDNLEALQITPQTQRAPEWGGLESFLASSAAQHGIRRAYDALRMAAISEGPGQQEQGLLSPAEGERGIEVGYREPGNHLS